MASRENLDKTYLRMAHELAKLSRAKRKQVGCLIVKDTHIIAEGYNGTPNSKFSNICEEEINGELVTKPEVVHSEANALAKLCKSTQSSEGATCYCTISPCFNCSKMLISAGITKVVYSEEYRDLSGVNLLKQAGITVMHIEI